jgi:hypothetical protein
MNKTAEEYSLLHFFLTGQGNEVFLSDIEEDIEKISEAIDRICKDAITKQDNFEDKIKAAEYRGQLQILRKIKKKYFTDSGKKLILDMIKKVRENGK